MNTVSREITFSIDLVVENYLKTEKFKKLNQKIALESLLLRMNHIKRSKEKSFENLFNEYENEKYGPALIAQKYRITQNSTDVFDQVVEEDPLITIRVFEDYYETTSKNAHRFYVDVMAVVFENLKETSFPLIDLGAGEGLTLLPLYQKIFQKITKCLAIDLSPSGLKKLKNVGEKFGFQISTMAFNLEEEIPVNLSEYEEGVVLTSFFLTCLPKIQKDYFQRISDLNPKYVLHFEPNYERLEDSKLQDALCRDYIVKNNYNENFESQLREFLSGQDAYEVFLEVENVFGKNALLPSSIIGWKLKTAE